MKTFEKIMLAIVILVGIPAMFFEDWFWIGVGFGVVLVTGIFMTLSFFGLIKVEGRKSRKTID